MGDFFIFSWGAVVGLAAGIHFTARSYRWLDRKLVALKQETDDLVRRTEQAPGGGQLYEVVRRCAHKVHSNARFCGPEIAVSETSRWIIEGKPIRVTVEPEQVSG